MLKKNRRNLQIHLCSINNRDAYWLLQQNRLAVKLQASFTNTASKNNFAHYLALSRTHLRRSAAPETHKQTPYSKTPILTRTHVSHLISLLRPTIHRAFLRSPVASLRQCVSSVPWRQVTAALFYFSRFLFAFYLFIYLLPHFFFILFSATATVSFFSNYCSSVLKKAKKSEVD